MRSGARRSVLLLVAAALVLAPVAFGDTSGGAAVVDRQWTKAMLANDLEAVMNCYGRGAVLWMPGAPMTKGEAEIRAAYKGFFDEYSVKSVTLHDQNYKSNGALSTGWGQYTMVLSPKKGSADVTMTGRYTEIVQRYKSRWVYVADHASADPSAATPAKK